MPSHCLHRARFGGWPPPTSSCRYSPRLNFCYVPLFFGLTPSNCSGYLLALTYRKFFRLLVLPPACTRRDDGFIKPLSWYLEQVSNTVFEISSCTLCMAACCSDQKSDPLLSLLYIALHCVRNSPDGRRNRLIERGTPGLASIVVGVPEPLEQIRLTCWDFHPGDQVPTRARG